MKTQLFGIALLVMALGLSSSALAQTRGGDVRVRIPFSFHVGSHPMPAGSYVVTSAADNLLRIYNSQDPHSHIFTPVNRVETTDSTAPKLLFHRYGNIYFLAQVWNGGGKIGKALPRSKAEEEIASGKINGSRQSNELAEVRP